MLGRKTEVWEVNTGWELPRWAPTVHLFLEGKSRKSILKFDILELDLKYWKSYTKEISQKLPHSQEKCIRYKRTEPRFIVGFSLGSYFNKRDAKDIKVFSGNKVLHMIDHIIRYSVGFKIPSEWGHIFWNSKIYSHKQWQGI